MGEREELVVLEGLMGGSIGANWDIRRGWFILSIPVMLMFMLEGLMELLTRAALPLLNTPHDPCPAAAGG